MKLSEMTVWDGGPARTNLTRFSYSHCDGHVHPYLIMYEPYNRGPTSFSGSANYPGRWPIHLYIHCGDPVLIYHNAHLRARPFCGDRKSIALLHCFII